MFLFYPSLVDKIGANNDKACPATKDKRGKEKIKDYDSEEKMYANLCQWSSNDIAPMSVFSISVWIKRAKKKKENVLCYVLTSLYDAISSLVKVSNTYNKYETKLFHQTSFPSHVNLCDTRNNGSYFSHKTSNVEVSGPGGYLPLEYLIVIV